MIPRRENRGAALIIAIALLAILMALALTFFAASRQEYRVASNRRDAVQAQFLADSGVAWAVALLASDLVQHPTFTSLDHAWNTYFNGSWYAGKPWLWRAGVDPRDGGLPLITDPVRAGNMGDDIYIPRVNPVEGPPSHDQMTLDIINNNSAQFPFVTPAANELYAETVDKWADVDLDGDGLRDAMFIPVPMDRLFDQDGIDNDLDGWIDEGPNMGSDGIDNNQNGLVDADDPDEVNFPPDGIDNDGDGEIDEPGEVNNPPEPETAPFVYWGLGPDGKGDGLDNDGDGLVDEADEARVFLTAPLLITIGSNVIDLGLPYVTRVDRETGQTITQQAVLDALDNDHNFVVNDSRGFGYLRTEPLTPELERQLYNVIAASYFPSHSDYVLSSTGEPVCDIAGRVAIKVVDEASKINLNVAHALAGRVQSTTDGLNGFVYQRVLNDGLSAHEMDIRGLPGFGAILGSRVPGFRTGGVLGRPLEINSYDYLTELFSPVTGGQSAWQAILPATHVDAPIQNPLAYDVSLPGYGFVDDDGTALSLSMNGLDDDGDGLVDEGASVPRATDPAFDKYSYSYSATGIVRNPGPDGYDDRYQEQLGRFEGVDDPFEYRLFRPFRNIIAEHDKLNTNLVEGDETYDEEGEMGDRIFHTREELKTLHEIAGARFMAVRDLVTVNSQDSNDRFARFDSEGNILDQPQHSGLKLDFNYATSAQIATALMNDWNYRSPKITATGDTAADDAQRFSAGLYAEAVNFVSGDAGANPWSVYGTPPTNSWLANREMKAHQLGANIVDNRDTDHARTESTFTMDDPWANRDADNDGDPDGNKRIAYLVAGAESIRINEIMARPTRRVEAEAWNANDYPTDPCFPANTNAAVFNPNTFYGANPNTPAAFDVSRRILPLAGVMAAWRGATPLFLGAANIADGWPLGATSELVPAVGVMGRMDTIGPNGPTAPHLGPESYLSFQNPVLVDAIAVPPVYTPYRLGATKIQLPGWPISIGQNQQAYTRPAAPNLVQYRFGPGPGLPPGRYYLMANVTRDGTATTATNGALLRYTFKYGVAGEDIVKDVQGYDAQNAYLNLLVAPDYNPITGVTPVDGLQVVGVPWVGERALPDNSGKTPTGWVFMPGLPQPLVVNDDPLTTVNESLLLDPYTDANGRHNAYTVTIPPYAPNAADQQYLYVAVWKDESVESNPLAIDPANDLVLNWFEFSQEPDHEYVEVVNTSQVGEPVDMSGWQLQVGMPGGNGIEDDYKLFTVPEGTRIAAGGSLLLAMNVFDVGAGHWGDQDAGPAYPGATNYTAMSRLARNGIGLAATDQAVFPMFGVTGTFAEQVTIPPLPNIEWRTNAFLRANTPLWPSVFYRPQVMVGTGLGYLDLVDVNGDGIADADPPGGLLPDNATLSSVAALPAGPAYQTLATALETAGPKKAWDRLVQLQSPELARFGVAPGQDLAELSRILLNGGYFPNYPEEDYIDNDNDNGVLITDRTDNNTDDPSVVGGVDHEYEGLDEGRAFLYARMQAPVTNANERPVPGGFNLGSIGYSMLNIDDDPVSGTELPGSAASGSPEWKAFVEKRFYPGDAVVVTLWEGPSHLGRVADRVTYTQRDVANASVDDAVGCPYVNEFGVPDTLDNQPGSSLWPDNTMGVDFYRAIERKHPLYSGDLCGTQNRWEPTDGNYDDWDSGQGPVYRVHQTNTLVWWDAGLPDSVTGTDTSGYGHLTVGAFGSPLRRNFFARAVEDPAAAALFPDTPANLMPSRLALRSEWRVPEWHYAKARVRDKGYNSPGEVARLPHFQMTKRIGGLSMIPEQERVDQVLLGHGEIAQLYPNVTDPGRNANDIDAVVSTGAQASITLSAAQADFYPLNPGPQAIRDDEPLVQWDNAAGTLPHGWTPVFLYNLDPTIAPGAMARTTLIDMDSPVELPFQVNFLFRAPVVMPPGYDSVGMFHESLNLRWPLVRGASFPRAAYYVASNAAGFDPTTANRVAADDAVNAATDPAEALFVWNADDGLANGEYDVYVSTLEDLSTLNALSTADRANLFSEAPTNGFNGGALLDAAKLSGSESVDVEFFTDRDGDRRCWRDSVYPDRMSVDRARSPRVDEAGDQESFGTLVGAAPSTQGLIYYGRVRVENNFLALFLRNWGGAGKLNRFSRVILTSSANTPGRINLNTSMTRDTNGKLWNPMTGMPGMLFWGFNGATGSYVKPSESDPLGGGSRDSLDPLASPYDAALARADRLLARMPHHVDGRYYKTPSETLTRDVKGQPDTDLTDTFWTIQDPLVDSTETPIGAPERFEESVFRFSRIANMATTRSDVFEIIVLAQSGQLSGTDKNNDGVIDWRNDFEVSGESRQRVVYQRAR